MNTKKADLNKLINKRTRRKKRKEHTKRIVEAIRKGKSLKQTRSTDHTGKQQMLALKDKKGKLIKNRSELTKVNATKINIPQTTKPMETIPDITVEEYNLHYET